jgi:hypothetical protein
MAYDVGPHDVISCIAQEDIPFGSYVRVSGGNCELADDTGEVTAGEGGVAMRVPTRVQGVGHKQGEIVPVMRQGRIWVQTEEGVAAQANPFVRFTADTGKPKGGWRNDADSAKAVQPSGVSVFRGSAGAGFICLQLNYPGSSQRGATGPAGP